jgi:hypothetical protein
MPIRQEHIVAPVNAELRVAFQRTISAPRWGTYLEAAGFHEDAACALYVWNAAVGQSFHFPLQAVEVALRNVIGSALRSQFGPSWWRDLHCCTCLGEDRTAEIDKAAHRIRRKYGGEPHTDQVVASLMLGFWVALLKRQYTGALWDHETEAAFPHLDEPRHVRVVSTAGDRVQEIRNRIFHHEPLIGRDLSGDYANMLRMLGWICPDTRDWVRGLCSVPVVLRQRPRAS